MLIHLNREDRRRLKEHFGCSEASLSLALHFKKGSLLAARIRSYAMNHLGGLLLE